MTFKPVYNIIFSDNGEIIVDKYYTEIKTIYLNHIYPDLTTFLCACAINDGEIIDTDEVYHEVREAFIYTCLTEDGEFNDVAINMSDADTVGRRIALYSFYSLSDSHIKYLQRKYNYFPDATNVFKDRLDQIGEELYNFHTILKCYYYISSLKNIVEKKYKNCLMCHDYSNSDLSEDHINYMICDINNELDTLQKLERKYILNEKLNVIKDKIKYLQDEKLTLKFNNKNSNSYISDENLKIKLKDLEEKMIELDIDNKLELIYKKLNYYSEDSTYDGYELEEEDADLELEDADLELVKEYKFLETRFHLLHQKQKN